MNGELMMDGNIKVASNRDTPSSSRRQDLADSELWQEILNSDKRALEALYYRHYDDLYKYANKLCNDPELTEDSIHDLFLKIWKRREEFKQVSGVKTYLWKSLRNSILSKLRKKNRRLKILNSAKNEVKPTLKLNVEELMIENENYNQILKELEDALSQLTPSHREVL